MGSLAAATLMATAVDPTGALASEPRRSTRTRMGMIDTLHGAEASVALDGGGRTPMLALQGFPQGYIVAVGERVVVSDRLGAEGQVQILPLVRFAEGVAEADGSVRIGVEVVRSPAGSQPPKLRPGGRTKVWISDNAKSATESIMSARPASQ